VEDRLGTILLKRLTELGHDCAPLVPATEIIVFGSCAVGLETVDSDLDVLCIGNGPRFKCRSLDLSWVSEEASREEAWLGSELAGHIAQYGVWLRGNGDWRVRTFTSTTAVERKRKRIISLSKTVTRLWDRLHPVFHSQYDVTIRRELQRLRLLEAGVRIPPTKILDNEWHWKRCRDLLEFRDSIEQLRLYEGKSNAPEILSKPRLSA
jgi:hypothetical protein